MASMEENDQASYQHTEETHDDAAVQIENVNEADDVVNDSNDAQGSEVENANQYSEQYVDDGDDGTAEEVDDAFNPPSTVCQVSSIPNTAKDTTKPTSKSLKQRIGESKAVRGVLYLLL